MPTVDPHSSGEELIDSDGQAADAFYLIVAGVIIKYSPDEDVDKLAEQALSNRIIAIFLKLKAALPQHYEDHEEVDSVRVVKNNIRITMLYNGEDPHDVSVKATIVISDTLHPSLCVHRQSITKDHDFWLGLPHCVYTVKDVDSIVSKFCAWGVCEGNSDGVFQSLVPEGVSICSSGFQRKGFREGSMGAAYSSTVRSSSCLFLVRKGISNRCSHCRVYRRTLWSMVARAEKTPSHVSGECELLKSHGTHSSMSREKLELKITQLKKANKELETERERLRREVLKHIKQHGTILNETDNMDVLSLLRVHQKEVEKAYPDEKSLPRLFWEEQRRYAELSDSRGMRWHPMIIRWCLYMQNCSSKAYSAMRDMGFVALPSCRTLFDYSNVVPSKNGFSVECMLHLKQEAEKLGLFDEEHQHRRYVGILQDEVQINQGLVYDRNSGILVGFTNLNEAANEVENVCLNDDCSQLASNMLVVMVRGATSSLKYPLACFATTGVTGSQLCAIVWEAIELIECLCNLRVIFVTCDGASPNRKFFKYHASANDNLTNWCWNDFANPPRKLYFISDVPHLLKTVRNCFSNSYCHNKTRRLRKNGRDISWQQIVNLYNDHVNGKVLVEAKKLTKDHVVLSSFNLMKVNLAAQVFSKTVANSLEKNYGDEVDETVKFIRHMDRFFDCLNVRNTKEHIQQRNPAAKPYTSVDDERLVYLRNDFLSYFDEWENYVHNTYQNLSKQDKNKLLLSHQSLLGLKISVHSICELVELLLNVGAPFVLTHHFNQDPLEEHFSHCRHKGGGTSNPTAYDFLHTSTKLKVVGAGATALASIRGNISKRTTDRDGQVDDTPLAKRQKHVL